MKFMTRQIGLSAAAVQRWRSYANVDGDGGVCLRGMDSIPAHSAYDQIDAFLANSEEPMT